MRAFLVAACILATAAPRPANHASPQYACIDDPALFIPSADTIDSSDHILALASLENPGGFGGQFWGRMRGVGAEDKMNIYFTDPDLAEQALISLENWDHNRMIGFTTDVSYYNVLRGDYSFAQLYACYTVLFQGPWPRILSDSLGHADIDEVTNRIHFGVHGDSTVKRQVAAGLAELSVPPEIFKVVKGLRIQY